MVDSLDIPTDRPVLVAIAGVAILAEPTARVAAVSQPAEPRGASAWITTVFDELGSRIQGMMLAATRDAEVAADVTQEAFLRLLREAQADRYPDKPSAWLYRTALNLVISGRRRAEVAHRLAPRLASADDTPLLEGTVLEREHWRAIGQALSRLSQTERSSLVMAGQGMTGVEIAARIGKSHAATRTLIVRARRRLRRLVEEQVKE